MINWFISNISKFFVDRRKPQASGASVAELEMAPPISVGEEVNAPSGTQEVPGIGTNSKPIDPNAMARCIAGLVVGQLAKLANQQGKDMTASLAQAFQGLSADIADNQTAFNKKVGEDVLRRLDKQSRLFQVLIDRSVTPMADRILKAMISESTLHSATLRKDVTESCSAATQRAALKPLVDQLIALFDRINDERDFLNSAYRREPDLPLHLGSRQLQERSDAAVRSFALEVLILLRSIGVEPLAAAAGPFDPQRQRVVGVEPTTRADLDGHIARIVRAGFTWNGTLHRPETVGVFKKEN